HRLRMGGARFRTLFDSLGLPLVVTDLQGGVLDVSPGLAALVGTEASALVTRPLDELLGEAGAGHWRSALERFSSGVRGEPVRFAVTLPGGRAGEAVCAPVADEDGEDAEVVVLLHPDPGP
ncbi:MAG: PAS domain-containing protein, partial [Longimicrobiales bacterium]